MKLLPYLPEVIRHRGIEFTKLVGDVDQLRSMARQLGVKYRIVHVLSTNLYGRHDIHGKRYKPSRWIYLDKSSIGTMLIRAEQQSKQLTLNI